VVVLVVLALVRTASADPVRYTCLAAVPDVNKPGFRPGQIVSYTTAPSPDGKPFPAALVSCVDRAFAAWTAANRRSGLDVAFVPGPGGIEVRFDKPGGLILPPSRAGAWSGGSRDADGALLTAHIWLTSNRDVLDSCEALTKALLHELGHLHGLADHARFTGPSVMNAYGGKNDEGEQLPMAPTRCDARQALVAAVVDER
jgi:hypothetical protein